MPIYDIFQITSQGGRFQDELLFAVMLTILYRKELFSTDLVITQAPPSLFEKKVEVSYGCRLQEIEGRCFLWFPSVAKPGECMS